MTDLSARQRARLAALQKRYPFKQSLELYFMGVSGKPEEQEQKALINCLVAEFPDELGCVLIPQPKTPHMPKELYTRLIVSTADFYDGSARFTPKGKRVSTQMQKYRLMGYQDGTLDITVLYPCNGWHGFLCEMKHGGGHVTQKGNIAQPGRASKEQRITIAELKKTGYYACVGKGFLDALKHWLIYLGR